MKIELTDNQISHILNNVDIKDLYKILERNKAKAFSFIKFLIFEELNTESYVNALRSLLEEVPIQKELFN